MVDTKKKNNIIKQFSKTYNNWLQSHQDCIEQKKINDGWIKEVKNKYTSTEIAQAIFPTWNKLHKIDEINAKKLIKETKNLLIVLISQYNFGNDIFQDFNIKINATYKNTHFKKIS